MAGKTPKKSAKQVETLVHEGAARRNIPTAELSGLAASMEEQAPFGPASFERANPLARGETRDRDEQLDPQIIWKGARLRLTGRQIETLKAGGEVEIDEAQLVWRGKDQQDWSNLIVPAPPLYIQDKVHPKVIIDDLKRQTTNRRDAQAESPLNLFEGFNGLDPAAKTEFYRHDQHWQNRMILGDSLQVMASLAERETLRGKVQCIYFDPPYGIKFNSNWQVSTRSRDVRDGKPEQITREPEQIKAFRDTWKDGIHSYLTYLRDRLTVMRDLLTDTGSIFVQIGDENVHYVRALMDEVFGAENYQNLIYFSTTGGLANNGLTRLGDYVLWYCRDKDSCKIRQLYEAKKGADHNQSAYKNVELPDGERRRLSREEIADSTKIPDSGRVYTIDNLCGQGDAKDPTPFDFQGRRYWPARSSHWKPRYPEGLSRLEKANRLHRSGKTLRYIRFFEDYPVSQIKNVWLDTVHWGGVDGKAYVVQTNAKVIERCILMSTDPGDLVLDPTCGSGTTATVAEQWGRRWITIDTSRVALALARTRLMAARYPYYYLADSTAGRKKEGTVSGLAPPDTPVCQDIRQGFVYQRAPHIMLSTISNNAEIDVIWDKWRQTLEPLREQLNAVTGQQYEEWQIPRAPDESWPPRARELHHVWRQARIARQREIDASIAQKAEVEYLYDRPYEDPSKIRVAGPFTVESLSPHRVIPAGADIDPLKTGAVTPVQDFAAVVLENLTTAGVHQSDKQDRIAFTAMQGWPGHYIAATGVYEQDGASKRAAIFIGPEFGSITRPDLMAAAREASEGRFDLLIACGFNFDAHSAEVSRLGPLPILKAKMNPDLHMADDLKNTGKGNLFVVFGEPDITWRFDDDGRIIVEVLGIDVFDPKTDAVRASGKDDLAAWFIDTDYDEESFFVRHAYFMGANDPYKSLKTSLKADIDEDAWATLYRDTSRPFPKPETGRFAVKVINHFGDEVMKVFAV